MACPETLSRPFVYKSRQPQKTLFYQAIQKELETWIVSCREDIPHYVEEEFRTFLKCGILSYGFARAYCKECGHDFLIAFSCKGRGICPSCTTCHMARIAAHLVDHVFPKAPVHQWVLSFPKRIRYFLHHDSSLHSCVLNILISSVEDFLIQSVLEDFRKRSNLRIGAVTFLQRFGKALNPHFHFHSCIIDGLFDEDGLFYPVSVSKEGIQCVQEKIRTRVLGLFQRRGLLEGDSASDMLEWEHSGFSLHADVRIEAKDRKGLERLLRYCARPVFSSERLQGLGEGFRYILPKPAPDGQMVLHFKPQELLNKLAQLIPPPRKHRHRYHGVLAPNSPIRHKIIAFANQEPASLTAIKEENSHPLLNIPPSSIPDGLKSRESKKPSRASLYRWALLLARIFEIFPLICPKCSHPMRIISFIQDRHSIRKVLAHINEPFEPPVISPARGPPEMEFDYSQ